MGIGLLASCPKGADRWSALSICIPESRQKLTEGGVTPAGVWNHRDLGYLYDTDPPVQYPTEPPVPAGMRTVRVTSASGTGRNLAFLDTSSGRQMSTKEFCEAIEAGQYPGYHVRRTIGGRVPASNPDNRLDNNLG